MIRLARWSIAVLGLATLFALPGIAQQKEDREKYQKAAERGLDWLKKQQKKDGAWSSNGQNPIAMTSLAGLAMLGEGSTLTQGKYRDEIRKAADWLIQRSSKAGARNGLIGDPDLPGETGRYMFGQGFAMVFLASVYGEEENKLRRAELKDILTRAVLFCAKAQSTQGGWFYTAKGDPPGSDNDQGATTVTLLQGLRACRDAGIPVPKEVMKKGADYLRKSTDVNGGVVYSSGRPGAGTPAGGGRPALTAGAIACLWNSGEFNDEYVKKWFKFCYNPDREPHMQKIPFVTDGGRIGFDEYTHYYYATAVYGLGDDGWGKLYPNDTTPKEKRLTWSMYRNASFAGILRTQDADGAWRTAGGWGSGPIFTTSIFCIILQLENNPRMGGGR